MWSAAVRIVTLAALAAFAFTGIPSGAAPLAERRHNLAVVGYVPEYRTGIDWDFVAKRATDLILFSVEPLPDGDLKPYFPIDDEGADSALVQAHRARNATRGLSHLPKTAREGGVRLLLCVGGGGRSESFASVASSAKTRAVLVSNLLQIVKNKQLQGVDFDWEVPLGRRQQADYRAAERCDGVSWT